MKKILFRKLLTDCLFFFLITLISASIIIWVFQAVNYLDIMVEDGRDYLVYIKYSLLNFPKIITKIFPFALFFSFFYIFSKYELNNEMMIFWNYGVNKILLINFFLKISLLIMLIQILMTSYIVPLSQNISRDLITSSDVDFFESFIKPKKFNDNIRGLTIYADQKDDLGNLKKIYLKKDTGDGNFQITFAKTGYFKNLGNSKYLVLVNGQTINVVNGKFSNFNFYQSELSLAELDSDIIRVDKIQETLTLNLINCLNRYFDKNLILRKNPKDGEFIQNCTTENLNNIFKELYKRFMIPLYIPILILASLFLMLYSKENINFTKFRLKIFLFGVGLIVFSETTLKFVENNFYSNLKIIIIPFLILLLLYLFIYFKSQNKILKD